MDWEDAVEEAKEELGYTSGEYISNWDEVVDTARYILQEENNKEYEDICIEAKENYSKRLESDYWKNLREKRLEMDKHTCKDCGNKATQVHHKRYVNMGTPWEIYELVSLCDRCHKKRHKIKEVKNE